MPLSLPPGTTIDATDDRLVVQTYKETGKWKEGSKIVVPQSALKETFFAKVVVMGKGKLVDILENGEELRKKPPAKVGDDILFARYHGERAEIDGAQYIIMAHDDIIAKVNLPEGSSGWFEFIGKEDEEMDKILEESRVKQE